MKSASFLQAAHGAWQLVCQARQWPASEHRSIFTGSPRLWHATQPL